MGTRFIPLQHYVFLALNPLSPNPAAKRSPGGIVMPLCAVLLVRSPSCYSSPLLPPPPLPLLRFINLELLIRMIECSACVHCKNPTGLLHPTLRLNSRDSQLAVCFVERNVARLADQPHLRNPADQRPNPPSPLVPAPSRVGIPRPLGTLPPQLPPQ